MIFRTWILWLVTLQKSWWKTWWLVSGWIIASQKHGLESCCVVRPLRAWWRSGFAPLTEYLYFWQEVCLAYQEKHLLTIQFDPAYKDDLHIRTIDEVLHVTYKEHPHIVSFSWWHCLWLCVGGDGESGQGWRLSFIYYVILLSICLSAQSSAHVVLYILCDIAINLSVCPVLCPCCPLYTMWYCYQSVCLPSPLPMLSFIYYVILLSICLSAQSSAHVVLYILCDIAINLSVCPVLCPCCPLYTMWYCYQSVCLPSPLPMLSFIYYVILLSICLSAQSSAHVVLYILCDIAINLSVCPVLCPCCPLYTMWYCYQSVCLPSPLPMCVCACVHALDSFNSTLCWQGSYPLFLKNVQRGKQSIKITRRKMWRL